MLIAVHYQDAERVLWRQWLVVTGVVFALATTKAFELQTFIIGFVRRVDVYVGAPVLVPVVAAGSLVVAWLFFRNLLSSIESRAKRLLFLGVAMAFLGGILLEALSEYLWTSNGPQTWAYHFTSFFEDILEFLGTGTIAYALYRQYCTLTQPTCSPRLSQ